MQLQEGGIAYFESDGLVTGVVVGLRTRIGPSDGLFSLFSLHCPQGRVLFSWDIRKKPKGVIDAEAIHDLIGCYLGGSIAGIIVRQDCGEVFLTRRALAKAAAPRRASRGRISKKPTHVT